MKLIGIMGKPGSGKTTFSDYLGCKDTVGVIHVDDLVADIKKKYFKFFLQPKENNKTENVKNNPKLKAGIKEKFYKNKFLFNILMKLRTKLIEKELLKKIEDFKLDGKEITVIDDWALPYQNKIFHKLDKIYTLERDFLERRDGSFSNRSAVIPSGFLKIPFTHTTVRTSSSNFGSAIVRITNRFVSSNIAISSYS